jgi:hypothetical protein
MENTYLMTACAPSRKKIAGVLLIALLALGAPTACAADKPELTQRIGDLLVTLLGAQQHQPQSNSDHHLVLGRFRAQSIAKQALCVGFSATLQASFGLQYRGSLSSRNAFRIRELLPGENTEGEFEFFVKNGSDPLRVILEPTSRTQTCTPDKDSFLAIWHNSEELKFDLSRLPELTSTLAQPDIKAESRIEDVPMIRVFLTGAGGSSPKENVVRTFQERCPQGRVTAVREKATYVVTIIPSSVKQSKNEVSVLNSQRDLIHAGSTFTLRNAASGACVAILKDFRAASKQDAPH